MKIDGRKLDHKTLEFIRKNAVKRVLEGESPEDVIESLGLHRSCIYDWISLYQDGGWPALCAKEIEGRPRKLSAEQEQWVYDTVTTSNPLQMKFKFALWTRAMIRTLIKGEFGIELSLPSISRLLKRVGLSCQKPLVRAYQKNPGLVEEWIQEDYPKIKTLAKKEGAEIFFADEAAVRSDYHSGTTWAPRGKTPVVEGTGARFRVNLISAVSSKGHMRFMVTKNSFKAAEFIEFLKRLVHNADRPIFLIVDGHPTHRAKKVTKFVESLDGRLRLFFLPPYSPELNPDEFVWNHLKNHNIGRSSISGPDDLKKKVHAQMRSLQKMPGLVRSFFRAPSTKYAAAM